MKRDGLPFRPSQSIPLVVNGIMYLGWPFNHVAAMDSETGKILWEFTARSGFTGKEGSMRSLEYWPGDAQSPPEILFATEEAELIALNAKTGKPIPGFGREGIVNLKTPEVMNGFPNLHMGISSAPFVVGNLVITGSHIVDETGSKGPAGDVRAWDVRSGKLVWTFHSVPRPGETGHETWQGDQWKNQSGVNVWTFFTADTERGILYMPFGSANNDYYGVDRQGPNLFANSLVAVDVLTGKLKWWFQVIHHDLWDYDLPVPPMLFDVKRNGKVIPAVGAMSKMGMLFILDRVTGKPIYGVEERPVSKGDLPGEYYSPTQPFPVKPPPLSRLSFTMDDIAKITPEHEQACRELLAKYDGGRNRGAFTPATGDGALVLPTTRGGAEWTGGAFDASLGYYIINTTDSGSFRMIRKQDDGSRRAPRIPTLVRPGIGGLQQREHPWLAVLATALGPAHRDRCQHRRYCLAGPVRHRGWCAGRHEDRWSEFRRRADRRLPAGWCLSALPRTACFTLLPPGRAKNCGARSWKRSRNRFPSPGRGGITCNTWPLPPAPNCLTFRLPPSEKR